MKKSEEINLNDRKIILARCAERDEFMKMNKLSQEHASHTNSFQLLNDETDYMVRNDNFKHSTTITTNDINVKCNEGIISSSNNKTLRNDMSELKNEFKKNITGVEYNRFYEPSIKRANPNFHLQIPKLNLTKKFKENIATLPIKTQTNPPVNNDLSSKQFSNDAEKMYQKNNQVHNVKPQYNPFSNNENNPQHLKSNNNKGFNKVSREKDNLRNKIIPNNAIDNSKFNEKNTNENENGRYLNSNYQNNAYERNVLTNKDTKETIFNDRSYNIEDERTTETFNSHKDASINQSYKEFDNVKMSENADKLLCLVFFLIILIVLLLVF
jgi:hypothetical protein